MQFIAMRELRNNPSALLDRLAREDLVITRRGKPAAALVYVDEDTLEAFLLSRHPTLRRELAAAKKEFRAQGGLNHATMKKRIQRRRG